MKVVTVTFFGHRDAPENLQPLLAAVLTDLMENHDANWFYVGNQGNFDHMVRQTLRMLKRDHPHIHYAVVLAYMPGICNTFDPFDYTDTIYPDSLASVPRPYAISRRNRWMIEKADTVITYVTHPSSGAAQFKALAEKKGKRMISLSDQK